MAVDDESCSGYFEAEVFTGRGEGGFYVSIYARKFREKLGFTPYPGTLNTRILDGRAAALFNECLKRAESRYIEPPQIEGARLGAVIAYRAVINDLKAWIVRPLITFYKDDVVEFISEIYLRGALNLKDGDRVKIRVQVSRYRTA
ncbi:MAG: CTP-dependent riboflavin kinase [Desulfurococcales archaeon]|nr:CTP-dependent riboflavin kinase [Desulfurococcales archaeon]